MTPLAARVVAGYWTSWGSPMRLIDIPAHYNTIFLFHATPVGGAPGSTGAVQWNAVSDERGAGTNFIADLAEVRRTRTVLLTIGGAQAHVDLSSRMRAQVFLDSIKRIYGDLGGFDGLDWNNYENGQEPDTDQMIWISQQLKATYGQDFAITSPPAPWREADLVHCRAMIDAGALDMVGPQYYDGPGLADASYIIASVDKWVTRMGDARRVCVGFGLANATDYSTREAIENAWTILLVRHPSLRGAFNWNISTDARLGWPFADHIGPIVMRDAPAILSPPASVPPLIPPIIPIPIRSASRGQSVPSGATTTADTAERRNPAASPDISTLGSGVPAAVTRLPQRIVGTYWFHASGLRLNAVHAEYNVVWVAFADPVGRGGHVDFDDNARPTKDAFKADLVELRRRAVPPKVILSSFGGPDSSPDLTTDTGADEFAADIIRICRDYAFDGFDWDLEHAPRFTAVQLERASRAIVGAMRETDPGFSLTAAPHLGPGPDFAYNDTGRVYADFVRRCSDILDLVQPQYYNRDDRVFDVTYIGSEVQAWLDCGLRQDQIGFLWMLTPTAIPVSDSQLVTAEYAQTVWSTLTSPWPGLRGMSTWSVALDQANGWRFATEVGRHVSSAESRISD